MVWPTDKRKQMHLKRLLVFCVVLAWTGFSYGQEVRTGRFEYLKGEVGSYPVTMTLCTGIEESYASYYYDRLQRPIPLFHAGDSSGLIKLVGIDQVEMKQTSDGYDGKLRTGDPEKTFPISLKRQASPVELEVYSVHLSFKSDSSRNDGPYFDYSLSTVWPKGDAPRQTFIARSIWKLLGVKVDQFRSIVEFMRVASKEDLADYRKALKEASPKDLADMPMQFSSESSAQVYVDFITNNFLSLQVFDYSYTGGAHGNAGASFANLDLKNLRVLGIDDVFTETGKGALPPLLETAFRSDKGLKPGQPLSEGGLFEDHIKDPSENILINGKGVIFHYGQYEIAPYSEGMVDIYLPWTAVKAYLTPWFAKRLVDGL